MSETSKPPATPGASGVSSFALTSDIPLASITPPAAAPTGPVPTSTPAPTHTLGAAAQAATLHKSLITRNRPPIAPTDDPVASLKSELQMTAAPNPRRMAELLDILASFVARLDTEVWESWALQAPQEAKPAMSLRQLMAKFLDPAQNATGHDMLVATEDLERLTVALVTAVNQGGHQFAQSHLRTFSPEAIKAAAGVNGSGPIETRAWKKYAELAAKINSESVGAEVADSIRDYVIEYLRR